jgi:subtilisin family serine protease
MKKAWKLTGAESLENKTLLSITPNDPRFNDQWALQNISAYQAWQYGTGSKDVVVAIIDSGIDLGHKELKNNLWTNPGEIPNDGVDNDRNGYVDDVHGWNFANNNNDVQDRYGHGTHVAGIIGAKGGNGLGVTGINWNVSLMTLKFMDDKGVGGTGGAIQAMDYISMMKNTYRVNVVVANASWGGGTGFSNMLYGAINRLNDAGIVLTVAAGNNGRDNDITVRYPSSYDSPNIISVGALGSYSNGLVSFSNYGATTVDLAAPGSAVLSTIPWNNYGYMSGTSMAAPMVAGAVSLLKSIKPSLTVSEVKATIFGSVDKIPELFGKVATGGKLNVGATIANVLGVPYDGNILPTGAITSQNLRSISGWAKDLNSPNSSISVRLIIDGADRGLVWTGVGGSFVFNLGGLTTGEHVISVEARDSQTGSWTSVASSKVTIPSPIVRVGYLRLNRVAGWAFSERSGASPVLVRVVINGRIVSGQWANLYRPALIPVVGSSRHGFNIPLNRNWFHKGANKMTIQVYDPISKQVSIAWERTINK